LVERPKQGFSAPLADWLRSDLHDWAADLIHGSKGSPSLNRPFCARLLAEHRSAQADHSGVLWCVLSFLAWADAWL
jgi:asparagine synthase (glutamine-hydrolysing)